MQTTVQVIRTLIVPMLLIGCLFTTATKVSAATCTRLATDFTLFSWHDASKWDCGFVPGPDDVAVIPAPADFFSPQANIALNQDIVLAGLEMGGGRLEGAYTITITEHMEWSGGNLHFTNTAPFTSPSVVVIAPGAELTVRLDGSIMSTHGAIINEGTTIWSTGAITNVGFAIDGSTGGRFINHGTFRATANNGGWRGAFENNGAMIIEPAGATSITISTLRNQGALTVRNGKLQATMQLITGTVTLDQGILSDASFESIKLQDGQLIGHGTIDGVLENIGGTVAPTGRLNIAPPFPGSTAYQQSATGTLAMSIRGTRPGSDYGFLSIGGSAQLDGTLEVNFTNGFTPNEEIGFLVMDCTDACQDEFATVTSSLPINYGTNRVRLGGDLPEPSPVYLPHILRPAWDQNSLLLEGE